MTAQDQPLVLILDDLHWADRDSLALLRYAARSMRQMRLLLVGIYRDTDLDRQHPLTDMLAIIHREI